MIIMTMSMSLRADAIYSILTLLIYIGHSESVKPNVVPLKCEHVNESMSCGVNGKICNETITCAIANACYAVWYNDTKYRIKEKGCWHGTEQCTSTCKAVKYSKINDSRAFFCCCQGDYCNRELGYTDNMQRHDPVPVPDGSNKIGSATTRLPITSRIKGKVTCDHYEHRDCKGGQPCNENKTVTCEACYASWRNDTSFHIVKKGCWDPPSNCIGVPHCISDNINVRQNKVIHFCCCDTDRCNGNFTFIPAAVVNTGYDTQTEATTANTSNQQQLFNTLCYSLVPIVGIFIIVVSLFWIWRRHAKYSRQQVPTHDPDPNPYPDNMPIGLPGPVELLELRAYGRFGAVWKAILNKDMVAVKIFPLQDKQSWLMERDIYSIPNLSHENILHFIAVDCKQDNLTTEFWLVTEYHERGSLYDYLKVNTLTWTELCTLTESMACGLAYLHEDIPIGSIQSVKPAIAHRDFKSKNVLLKNDLTACIADFGLAMKFDCNRGIGDTHAQVGTRRYMAPEVLEGAIAFSRDAFLRIDMYACGLVLWEIVTRCTVIPDVGEYELPFQDSIGLHPSLENMQDLVVTKKSRPLFKSAWLNHPGLNSLCVTIDECWDHDSEGRLSAQCVKERISQVSQSLNISTSDLNESDTPLDSQLRNLINDPQTQEPQTVIQDPQIIPLNVINGGPHVLQNGGPHVLQNGGPHVLQNGGPYILQNGGSHVVQNGGPHFDPNGGPPPFILQNGGPHILQNGSPHC